MDNDEEFESQEIEKKEIAQKRKNIFNFFLSIFFSCSLLNYANSEEQDFVVFTLAGLVFLSLLDYAWEFRKPPEVRNYIYLFWIISFFIGGGLGYLLQPNYQGVLSGAGLVLIFSNLMSLIFPKQINDRFRKLFIKDV